MESNLFREITELKKTLPPNQGDKIESGQVKIMIKQARSWRVLTTWIVSILIVFVCCGGLAGAEQIGNYYFPQITTLNGYPVYQIGDVAIYRVSPTFVPHLVLQGDNTSTLTKIIPKRSHEIKSNYVGAGAELMPTTLFAKKPTNEAILLIDGDPATGINFPGLSTPSAEDPLNGVRQELKFNVAKDQLRIPKLMLKDYPILIRIYGVN